MIFIVCGPRVEPPPGVRVVLVRRTPPLVADGDRQVDFFCVADDTAPERLRAEGWPVVAVHDGWYADDDQGGVAVWGQGRYWEVRPTPFDVVRRDTDLD
jgi:hypothetical protein